MNKRLLKEPPLLTKAMINNRVSVCLIFIYWRFSVQFVTKTSHFTLTEINGLVYKPHPRFLTQTLSKKVQLIHESLQYIWLQSLGVSFWGHKNWKTIALTWLPSALTYSDLTFRNNYLIYRTVCSSSFSFKQLLTFIASQLNNREYRTLTRLFRPSAARLTGFWMATFTPLNKILTKNWWFHVYRT